jgi:hypothetical protein
MGLTDGPKTGQGVRGKARGLAAAQTQLSVPGHPKRTGVRFVRDPANLSNGPWLPGRFAARTPGQDSGQAGGPGLGIEGAHADPVEGQAQQLQG